MSLAWKILFVVLLTLLGLAVFVFTAVTIYCGGVCPQ